MRICAQVLPFDEPLESVFQFLQANDIEYVDLNCSEYFSPADIELERYVDDEDAQNELLDLLDDYGMEIAVLGATNNPLHPRDKRASLSDRELRDTIRLADQLGVDTVTCFSGLPGGSDGDVTPNWVTAAVPPNEQAQMHEYQWEEVAIPYWRDIADLAESHGVDVGIEMHLNMLVHNPPGLRRLRDATNERIGAYFDPAHLELQQIDVIESIRYLAEKATIHYFELSDVQIHPSNMRLQGVNDMTPLPDSANRSWEFCTVGYGHGEEYWKDVLTALDIVGYDDFVSIQQLRTRHSTRGGVEKGTRLLQDLLFE